MAEMTVNCLGLRFRTPVIAGAGPQTDGTAALASAMSGGAGALVSRTLFANGDTTQEHAHSYEALPYGRDGLLSAPAPTPEDGAQSLAQTARLAQEKSVPLIASITGAAESIAPVAIRLVSSGVQALEYATQYVTWDVAVAALTTLRHAVSLPIIAKLSLTHGEDIADRAQAIESLVDGFTCIAPFGPVLDLDIEGGGNARLGSPHGYGYLSGQPIHPIAVRTVFEVARRVHKPVLAAGGAMRPQDIAEFLAVGASLVQVNTAAILKGPSIYGTLTNGLRHWLDERGIQSVSALTATYLQRFGNGQRVVTETEEAPLLTAEACSRCSICGDVCCYDAIAAPKGQLPAIDPLLCFQCGLCVSACPSGALSFRPRSEVTLPQA